VIGRRTKRRHRRNAGAAKFLAHPRVAEASLEKRIAFLKSQDIPEEDIETALSQASLAAADEAGLDEEPPKARRKKKKKMMKKKKAAAELNPRPPPPPSFLSCIFCQK